MRTFSTLLIAASAVQAAPITAWSGGPTYEISYDTSKEAIKIDATVPDSMWLGIVWGVGMTDSDMVLFQGSGSDG